MRVGSDTITDTLPITCHFAEYAEINLSDYHAAF